MVVPIPPSISFLFSAHPRRGLTPCFNRANYYGGDWASLSLQELVDALQAAPTSAPPATAETEGSPGTPSGRRCVAHWEVSCFLAIRSSMNESMSLSPGKATDLRHLSSPSYPPELLAGETELPIELVASHSGPTFYDVAVSPIPPGALLICSQWQMIVLLTTTITHDYLPSPPQICRNVAVLTVSM